MVRMQFGLTAFERARGDLPQLPVVNMFAEEAPTEQTGVVLQSRPPLEDRSADMGSGPVDALFRGDGILGGSLFGVSAAGLWEETSLLGSIDGTGPFSLDGYADTLFLAGGQGLWGYDGSTLAQVAVPDDQNVIKCLIGASRLIILPENAETYYWSDVLSDSIDALSFASAESRPDRLRDALFIDDTLILGGVETIEFHPNTNDSDLPFAPLEGRIFEKGVLATGCMCPLGASFAWVTNEWQVCLGDPDRIISNPGLEEKIKASSAVKLFRFLIDGDEFLGLRLDDKTYCRGERSGLWSEMASYGQGNWIPQCWANGVFGSGVDGKTYAFGTGPLDAGQVFERRFRSGFALNSGGVSIDNIILRTNVGQTTYLTGDYTDPQVEMRLSWDAGQTWDDWEAISLGVEGAYDVKVMWAGLGMASQPGLLAEFRVTAPVSWRVSDVLVNEPYGGRA